MVENFIPNNIESWIESSYDLIEGHISLDNVYVFRVYEPQKFINRFNADNDQWNAFETTQNGNVFAYKIFIL